MEASTLETYEAFYDCKAKTGAFGICLLYTSGIDQAYRTGRGKIKVRAVTNIEPMKNGKQRIIVSELPYMVNKARLIEKIADLVKEKRVDGITELRDESDRRCV